MRSLSRMGRTETTIALYSSLALLGVLWGAVRGDVNVYRLADRASLPNALVISPLAGLALGLIVVFASRLAVHRFEWARVLHREFRGVLGRLSAGEALILALTSGVGEEVFFRGALQPSIGLFPQAIVFSLLHVAPGKRFLPWTASAFVMGVAFGGLFEGLGDLGAPIVAHVTINYLNLRHISTNELL
jgi:membrane protease YdiL (CAAX protease family)